jgi:hypothetical protein
MQAIRKRRVRVAAIVFTTFALSGGTIFQMSTAQAVPVTGGGCSTQVSNTKVYTTGSGVNSQARTLIGNCTAVLVDANPATAPVSAGSGFAYESAAGTYTSSNHGVGRTKIEFFSLNY